MRAEQVAAQYGDDNVFLFLGGFLVALALEDSGLPRRIALRIVAVIPCGRGRALADEVLGPDETRELFQIMLASRKWTPLEELYYNSPLLQALGEPTVASGCEACQHARQCGGVARGLAFATTGSPFAADPGCWNRERK